MKLGDLVKVTIDDVEYLAKIVSYNTTTQLYGCSIYALGKVLELEASDIDTL